MTAIFLSPRVYVSLIIRLANGQRGWIEATRKQRRRKGGHVAVSQKVDRESTFLTIGKTWPILSAGERAGWLASFFDPPYGNRNDTTAGYRTCHRTER